MKNSDQTAFPTHPAQHNGLQGEEYSMIYGENGLTKREYFAAKAMQGIMASGFYTDAGIHKALDALKVPHETGLKQAIAMMAIEVADELLKQLESK